MRLVWAIACAELLLAAAVPTQLAAAEPPVTAAPQAAVWKEQRLNFTYMGRTARYSCDGLRDKIRGLLLELGVRRDLQVTAMSCDDSRPGTRSNSIGPSLSLVFSAVSVPNAAAQPVVDARFEQFTIGRDVFRNLDVGDCELVEQFAHQVLPKLTARDVKEDIACVPNQLSGSRFLVRGEILRPLQAKAP
jgi:hypothetical protein